MPEFETLSLSEAQRHASLSGKRGAIMAEYLGYIERLQGKEQAGRLRATAGESVGAIRRRLGAAARLAGKELVIRRVGEEIVFWPGPAQRRRRGRPRKAS